MSPITYKSRSLLLAVRVSLFLLLLSLAQTTTRAQAAAEGDASLRGKALVNQSVAVAGVRVVLVRTDKDRAAGNPVPAIANDQTGDYRIGQIVPGSYDLRASGKEIKPFKKGVVVAPGNSNEVHLDLKRAGKRTKVRGKIKDGKNRVQPNQDIKAYPAIMPPEVCPLCYVTQATSDESGEVVFEDLESSESYVFAISMKEEKGEQFVTSGTMTLGGGEQNTIAFSFDNNSTSGKALIASFVDDLASPASPGFGSKPFRPTYAFGKWRPELYELKGSTVLRFPAGSSELSAEVKERLDNIIVRWKASPNGFVGLKAMDSESFPQWVTDSQQKVIVNYLMTGHQVPLDRILLADYAAATGVVTATSQPTIRIFEVVLLADKSPPKP
ncbi:MAG TPA: carboxypeptidase-like regulatory domain-containing protein [Pyrinomonadaceae bacterium]|nr:carboxypeptidase-like regulatory domain-containing protein [Pyrinomonadaceae bacterium]